MAKVINQDIIKVFIDDDELFRKYTIGNVLTAHLDKCFNRLVKRIIAFGNERFHFHL